MLGYSEAAQAGGDAADPGMGAQRASAVTRAPVTRTAAFPRTPRRGSPPAPRAASSRRHRFPAGSSDRKYLPAVERLTIRLRSAGAMPLAIIASTARSRSVFIVE